MSVADLAGPGLVVSCAGAADTAMQFADDALDRLCSVSEPGVLLEEDQRAFHGVAWIKTLATSLRASAAWLADLSARGAVTRSDELALVIGFNEFLLQLVHGLPMSQTEIFRPSELALTKAVKTLTACTDVELFLSLDVKPARAELTRLLAAGHLISDRFGDEVLDQFRDQLRRFADDRIVPVAHQLHLQDALVPDDLLQEMAELGIFGLCISEEYGGLGLGKLAMCVVTEELSRAWIATGSLGTRAEIAGELITQSGSEKQKARWLPLIASGECLPTAVFTEPDTGSDLGALRTCATVSEDGDWRVNGSKTWITHAARSDLMTMLVRTDTTTNDHTGLSILLAEKPRGSDTCPFPAENMDGGEIEVLGYRGMKEYTLSFDDYAVSADGLLGNEQGQGFRQLMHTFEGARIQTAARAIGVARRANELGLQYAIERKQFGKAIVAFPRISDKIAISAAECLMARELTYLSARQKDEGHRCDIEAGMAKLIAARVAWSSADAALQIHGGNGYALEYEISRILCDARILNIFEGAAEIQAQVIARGLMRERQKTVN